MPHLLSLLPRSMAVMGLTLLTATFAGIPATHAASGLCDSGARCSMPANDHNAGADRQLLEFGAVLSAIPSQRSVLSSEEYFSFSGVGAIVCTIAGVQHMSTAFLVGAFDIAVTVAHTFETVTGPANADDCIYTSTDSLGQIRERIAISYIKSQWESEPGTSGHAATDFAVVRLKEASHYAQRTMPLGRFSGNATAALMVGFRSDLESDPLKSKGRGTVYEHKVSGTTLAPVEGFTHDIDARGIAAGAPVIDETTGVIIGVHTLATEPNAGRPVARNTMITLNEWLEQTLRAEMQRGDAKGADSAH